MKIKVRPIILTQDWKPHPGLGDYARMNLFYINIEIYGVKLLHLALFLYLRYEPGHTVYCIRISLLGFGIIKLFEIIKGAK